MSNPYIIWAIICLAAAAALFFVEIFIPSGGLIGLLAGLALVAGVILLFMFDTTVGLVGAIVVLCCIPIFVGMAIKIWPNTTIARFLTLRTSQASAQNLPPAGQSNTPETGPRVGDSGKALTELRPIGVCMFDGQRRDCLAAGPMIPAGTPVKIVTIEGMQIKVRRA